MSGSGATMGDQPDAGTAPVVHDASLARERQSHVRHELRAPLAVIYPLLSLLLDGGAGELTMRQREYLEVLDRNVERLAALITGAAASGWADCSAAPRDPATVALGDVAEELVAQRAAEGARSPLVVVEAPAPSPRAFADREDVRLILGDLVRNAAAYASSTARVTIRARGGDDPDTVVLEVEDSGPGIPPEELDRVFEFGFRGELARALKVPGLGAGLWISRELARRNGGEVELLCPPGAGVTATLTLPAAQG